MNGTNFEALNVPLLGGTNIITAVIQDLTENTNYVSINIVGLTNADGSLNNPVELQATPTAGFAPLTVNFQIAANVPGNMQQVFYDFNGDDIADFATNSTDQIAYSYATYGEYFPVVTIQTDAGRFSSIGGWNAVVQDPTNAPIIINVESTLTKTTFTSVIDPVALKWAGTNLYVLSGSTATITEFDSNANIIRSLTNIGSNPCGFDVDAAGNIYVAVTASNQVWKLNPTTNSFQTDTTFGWLAGAIGTFDGSAGTNIGEFNMPFDVAVRPDGGAISVSDSANNRIEIFNTNGNFLTYVSVNKVS